MKAKPTPTAPDAPDLDGELRAIITASQDLLARIEAYRAAVRASGRLSPSGAPTAYHVGQQLAGALDMWRSRLPELFGLAPKPDLLTAALAEAERGLKLAEERVQWVKALPTGSYDPDAKRQMLEQQEGAVKYWRKRLHLLRTGERLEDVPTNGDVFDLAAKLGGSLTRAKVALGLMTPEAAQAETDARTYVPPMPGVTR